MPDTGRNDRKITILVVLSILVAILVVLGTPAVISTSNTTAEVREGNAVAACRSEAGSVVTAARTQLDVSNARLNVLVSQAIQSAIEEDQPSLLETNAALPGARDAVTAAEVELADAIDRYRNLLELSREDPSAFLSLCE